MRDRKLLSVLSCSYGNWLSPARIARTVLSALCSVPGVGARAAVTGPGPGSAGHSSLTGLAEANTNTAG